MSIWFIPESHTVGESILDKESVMILGNEWLNFPKKKIKWIAENKPKDCVQKSET